MKLTHSSVFSRRLVGAACLATAALAGCAGMNETGRNSAIGAGVGALGGAAIGRNATGAAIGAGVGALGGYAWSQYMQQKKMAMEQATVGTGVAVTQTPDNQLKVNIPSDVSFDTNSAVIKPNMRPVLDQFASGIANQPNTEIRITGHTDSTGTDAINNPLSVQRAQSVRDYLAARGVNPQQVAINGVGDRQPVADNGTAQGRAENRRVEMFLAERAVAQGPTYSPGSSAVASAGNVSDRASAGAGASVVLSRAGPTCNVSGARHAADRNCSLDGSNAIGRRPLLSWHRGPRCADCARSLGRT